MKVMKVRIKPFTVEIDPKVWAQHFDESTPAEIRAGVQAATEEWVNNYIADIHRQAGQS